MWWLDDLVHEIVTVAIGAFVLFVAGIFFGYFLRSPWLCSNLPVFRRTCLCSGVIGSFFTFSYLIPEELELALVAEIFLFTFFWGLSVGFEQRWIYKELFSLDFWCAAKED